MSVTIDINNVPVQFPFEPYDIQKDYMQKVVECIQSETTAVLESPTGTGKTLSLLCSSLAWLQMKKAQVQAQRQMAFKDQDQFFPSFLNKLVDVDEKADTMAGGREFLGVPTIIYASRTHSQLNQAIQELKRTAYNHMYASVLGSREQLCIHPEVIAEQENSLRLQMCRLKVASRSCQYNNRVEKKKEDPEICNAAVVDIEDMVKLGNKHTFCPYYMTKERQQKADIIFTPYNYLLDPIARKSLGLKLSNAIIILDEGHNIEKVCEESASIDIKSTDVTLAIDETTHVMKMLSEAPGLFEESVKGDIDPENVAFLKEILLMFEKAMDEIPLSTTEEVTNYPGDYIYEVMEKAQITMGNVNNILALLDNMVQYLAAQNEGPFARKGKGLQLFNDFLIIVFQNKASKEKVRHCYKVHIRVEEVRTKNPQIKTWLDKKSTMGTNRILCYWCFCPGFGMESIISQGIKALILTSGTLAPLNPLISELELDVKVRLENPHIVKGNQICVKIVTNGPDGEPLNSSYRNRENPQYVRSLGMAIVNLSRIVPNGLLIFFPSYPVMLKCQATWEREGIWTNILAIKAIFVEPRGKEAFHAAMSGYYEKIRDPKLKGAIFMAVCRGKVSEGLDFADINGRAVIITGLPYPPLKDPRVILKRRYLDTCHQRDKEYLTGQDWYSLEGSRAVNQAIGRVIRHRHDYGAILLLDERFNSFAFKEKQMSMWLREHVKVVSRYGELIRDLSQFFKKAQADLPAPQMKPPIMSGVSSFEAPQTYRKSNFDFSSSSTSSLNSTDTTSQYSTSVADVVNKYIGTTDNPNGTVSWKRENQEPIVNTGKRKKFNLVSNQRFAHAASTTSPEKASLTEYVVMVKSKLGYKFKEFANSLKDYKGSRDIEAFINAIDTLVPRHLRYILVGLDPYITGPQRVVYRNFLRRNNLAIPEDL